MAQKVGELEAELLLEISDFVRNAKKAQGTTKKFGSAMKVAGVAIGAAVAGIFVAVKAFKQINKAIQVTTKAAGIQEAAMVKLTAALRTAGVQDAPAATREFANFAAELQKVTVLGDETTIAAASIGASFGITGDRLQETVKSAADLSAAIGVDLKAAMILLGKAAKGEVGTLSRYGIIIDKGLPPSEKFEAALAAINKQFSGAAQAAALTYTGRMTQLKNAHGDLLEEIGFVITKNKAFNALLVEGRKALEEASQSAKDNQTALGAIVSGGISVVLTGIASFIRGLGNVVLAFKLVQSGGSTFKAFVADIGVGFLDIFIKMAEGINAFENRIREFFGKPPAVDELLEEIKRVRDGLVESRDASRAAADEQAKDAVAIQEGFSKAAAEVDSFRRSVLITAETVKTGAPVIAGGVKAVTDETAALAAETKRLKEANKLSEIAEAEKRAELEKTRAEMEAHIEVGQRFGSAIAGAFLEANNAQDAWVGALRAVILTALDIFEDFVVKTILGSAVTAAGQQAASVSAVPPPLGPILMAAAATAAFALVKGLLSKAKFQRGGIVGGPSGPDQVPALLTRGEAVLPTPVVDEIARVLRLPRASRPAVPFQRGGIVGQSAADRSMQGINVNLTIQTQTFPSRADIDRAIKANVIPSLRRLKAKGAI